MAIVFGFFFSWSFFKVINEQILECGVCILIKNCWVGNCCRCILNVWKLITCLVICDVHQRSNCGVMKYLILERLLYTWLWSKLRVRRGREGGFWRRSSQTYSWRSVVGCLVFEPLKKDYLILASLDWVSSRVWWPKGHTTSNFRVCFHVWVWIEKVEAVILVCMIFTNHQIGIRG